jgi:hypothetical protein
MRRTLSSVATGALSCVLLSWAPVSLAAALEVPAPEEATIVEQRPEVEQERLYPMGAVRKISGQLRIDQQVVGKGQARSVTYQLPPERTAGEVFASTRQALRAQGAQLLYWCEARDCGESSLWANEIFGNSRLYGSDEQQAFLLLRQAAPADDRLIALYSITRGNRRAYLHVEQFQSSTPLGELLPTPATVLRELRHSGSLDYPALGAVPEANWVALLARSLNQDSTLRLSISGQGAEAWREALVEQGVRSARLEGGTLQTPGLHLELIR